MNTLNELTSNLNKKYIVFTGILIKLRDIINQMLSTSLVPVKDWQRDIAPLQKAVTLIENTYKEITETYNQVSDVLTLYKQEEQRSRYVAELATRVLNNELTATDVINVINSYYGSELFNPMAFQGSSLRSLLEVYDPNNITKANEEQKEEQLQFNIFNNNNKKTNINWDNLLSNLKSAATAIAKDMEAP